MIGQLPWGYNSSSYFIKEKEPDVNSRPSLGEFKSTYSNPRLCTVWVNINLRILQTVKYITKERLNLNLTSKLTFQDEIGVGWLSPSLNICIHLFQRGHLNFRARYLPQTANRSLKLEVERIFCDWVSTTFLININKQNPHMSFQMHGLQDVKVLFKCICNWRWNLKTSNTAVPWDLGTLAWYEGLTIGFKSVSSRSRRTKRRRSLNSWTTFEITIWRNSVTWKKKFNEDKHFTTQHTMPQTVEAHITFKVPIWPQTQYNICRF